MNELTISKAHILDYVNNIFEHMKRAPGMYGSPCCIEAMGWLLFNMLKQFLDLIDIREKYVVKQIRKTYKNYPGPMLFSDYLQSGYYHSLPDDEAGQIIADTYYEVYKELLGTVKEKL